MKIARMYLVGVSPLSFSRHYSKEEVPQIGKDDKEAPDAYDRRTWRNRLHTSSEGFVEIPGSMFSNSIKNACKRLSLKVPGKGTNLYAKYFEAGVMVPEGLTLNIKASEVKSEELFVPSDGKRGGGKRVTKTFPRLDAWEGLVTYYIFDEIIDRAVFTKCLVSSGQLVGIGRFRPERWGFYGRFIVDEKRSEWIEDGDISSIAAAAGVAL